MAWQDEVRLEFLESGHCLTWAVAWLVINHYDTTTYNDDNVDDDCDVDGDDDDDQTYNGLIGSSWEVKASNDSMNP